MSQMGNQTIPYSSPYSDELMRWDRENICQETATKKPFSRMFLLLRVKVYNCRRKL